jgi:hypothetical protein
MTVVVLLEVSALGGLDRQAAECYGGEKRIPEFGAVVFTKLHVYSKNNRIAYLLRLSLKTVSDGLWWLTT